MEDLRTLTDEQLVKLYVNEINEAFDVLLDRYKDKLFSYILYSVQNEDEANDLFQETFIKAIVNIRNGHYVDTGKFYPWLTRIAHNLIIDQFRCEKNENTISNDESEADLYDMASASESNIENEIISEQILEDVQKLVNFLPDTQQEIIRMRFYQNLSFKEISKITGVSINTALGRIRYAILNMRKLANQNNMCLSCE